MAAGEGNTMRPKRNEWQKFADQVRVLHAAFIVGGKFNLECEVKLARLAARAAKLAPWPDDARAKRRKK